MRGFGDLFIVVIKVIIKIVMKYLGIKLIKNEYCLNGNDSIYLTVIKDK